MLVGFDFDKLKRIFLFLFIEFFVNFVYANPSITTYQAKIIKPDGYPLEANGVNFKFTILDPAGTCILFSENYNAVDMTGTAGMISFSLGSGVKTYPASSTTFAEVFSNSVASLTCDDGDLNPPHTYYNPSATDIRKIVMQFQDANGWQTLPAMAINAVPYAMYAGDAQKLGGVSATSYVQYSSIPTCGASESLRYNGASFSCITVGGNITSGDVTSALLFTPADQAVVGSSFTTVTSTLMGYGTSISTTALDLSTVSSTVAIVSSTVASITSSQWVTSGTGISYSGGNVGVGISMPTVALDVNGAVSGTQMCLAGDCITSWPSTTTVPNVISGSALTTDRQSTAGTATNTYNLSSYPGASFIEVIGQCGKNGVNQTSYVQVQFRDVSGTVLKSYTVCQLSNASTQYLVVAGAASLPIYQGVKSIVVNSYLGTSGDVNNRTYAESRLLTGGVLPTTMSTLADADTDTKIQTEESSNENKIRFDTGGSERMIIDNSGNVGIGTSSPGQKLTVSGTIESTVGVKYPDGVTQTTAAIITDWVDAGVATIGATTTPPTKGAATVDKMLWRRVGDTMELRWDYIQAVGAAGSGTYLITIPGGYAIDSTKLPVPSNAVSRMAYLGTAAFYYGGAGKCFGSVYAYNSTQFFIDNLCVNNSGGSGISLFGSGQSTQMSTTLEIGMKISFPVSGW